MMPATSSPAASFIDIDQTFLPVGRMRQITCVTAVGSTEIEGEVALGPDHWVYPEHFPGDPIFPGTLQIEAAGQLIALFAWLTGRRGAPRLLRATAEFLAPVQPSSPTLSLKAVVRQKRRLYFGEVEVCDGEVLVGRVSAVLAVLPKEILQTPPNQGYP